MAKAKFDKDTCATYDGAPRKCVYATFVSGDGSIRCHGCHLHPDQCTCGEETLHLAKVLGLID